MEKYFCNHRAWQPAVGSCLPACCKFPPALFPWWNDVICQWWWASLHTARFSHISPAVSSEPLPLFQLEPQHMRWHTSWQRWSKSLILTLFPRLHRIPAKTRCWHFSALLESIPRLLSHFKKKKKRKEKIRRRWRLFWTLENWSGFVFLAITGLVFTWNLRIGNRRHAQLQRWPVISQPLSDES